MSIDWSHFCRIVANHERFLLTSHVRPDCDALGSELGLADALESLGRQVRIVNGDAPPRNLAFIDPRGRVEVLGRDVSADELADVDVLIVLDTSAWIQLGPMAEVVRESNALKVIVDHHVSEDDLGAEVFKDPQAEAAGRLVLEAIDALAADLGAEGLLSAEAATALFAAVATDTGWFRFPSVTAQTYRAASRLVEAGASPAAIYADLYERETEAQVQLRGRILASATSELDGRLLYAEANRADFEATGAGAGDTEGAINMLLRIDGSEVALLFVELGEGPIKVSFRSRGTIDVRKMAEQFGGGGHTAAAGARVPAPLASAREQILDAVRAGMR